MARSAAKRRERREAVSHGAPRKPPETYQPSERAAEVRLVMHETVSEQVQQMNMGRRKVRSVPLSTPAKVETSHAYGLGMPELAELLAEP